MNKVAGLLWGDLEHHFDHLAVFCSFMQIPLIVTEETFLRMGSSYYPDLEISFIPPLEAPFQIVEAFEKIIYSIPKRWFNQSFLMPQWVLGKKLQTMWLPHGYSDKGCLGQSMRVLQDEETIFYYGPKMRAALKRSLSSPIPLCLPLGNYRFRYYLQRKSFYDKILDELGLPSKKVILYAPTWEDLEKSSSFFEVFPHLVEQIPAQYSVIVKPHPNLILQDRFQELVSNISLPPNILFLNHFPPIYPLLNRADIYVGDNSSVGYDFLSFNRPMYFIQPSNCTLIDPPLHRCGHLLKSKSDLNLFELLERLDNQENLRETRAQTALEVFGPQIEWEEMGETVATYLGKTIL